jgi:hypothetical protein
MLLPLLLPACVLAVFLGEWLLKLQTRQDSLQTHEDSDDTVP